MVFRSDFAGCPGGRQTLRRRGTCFPAQPSARALLQRSVRVAPRTAGPGKRATGRERLINQCVAISFTSSRPLASRLVSADSPGGQKEQPQGGRFDRALQCTTRRQQQPPHSSSVTPRKRCGGWISDCLEPPTDCRSHRASDDVQAPMQACNEVASVRPQSCRILATYNSTSGIWIVTRS